MDTILLTPPPPKTYVLTHINSANDFYLQEAEDATIGPITDLAVSLEGEAPLSDVSVGDLVGAKFVEDEQWYRARVISKDGGETKVLFVDYGNTSIASEFRALSGKLASFPPCAIHGSLFPRVEGSSGYSQAATAKFIELSQGGEMLYTCEFVGGNEDDPRPACLYIGEDKVADLLKDVVESASEHTEANAGGPTATILWVNSPDDFYIQTNAVGDALDVISGQLEGVADLPPLEVVTPGDIVLAQFVDDEEWYRSKVLEKTDEGYTVLFIDYGNSSPASVFKALPDSLAVEKIPPCATKVGLVRPSALDAWPAEATDALNEYVDKELEVEMLDDNFVELRTGGKRVSCLIAGVEETDVSTPNEASKTETVEKVEAASSKTEAVAATEASSEAVTPGAETACSEVISSIPKNAEEPETASTPEAVSPTRTLSPTKTPTLKEKARASEKSKIYLITHVNSPDDFYLLMDAQASVEIGQHLKNAAEFEKVDSIIVGATYASFNEQEDVWHRAQLISIEDDEAETGLTMFCVKYTDLGNTDVVTKDCLRELPDHVRELPKVVRNCSLETSDECVIWCDAAVEKMTDLAVTERFLIEKMSDGDPAWVVLKTKDGVDVNEMLLQINATAGETGGNSVADDTLNDTIISEAPSKDLSGQRVVISSFESEESFHVQVVKDRTILESINSLLDCLKPVVSGEVAVGDIYAGKIEADGWYRVRVIEVLEEGGYQVRRIDYGDAATCSELKKLNEDLSHIGALAHPCAVKDGSGSKLAVWREKGTELVVEKVEEGEKLVVTLREDGEVDGTESQANGVDVASNGDVTTEESVTGDDVLKPSVVASSPVSSPTSEVKSNGLNASLDETFVSCVGDSTLTGASDQEVYIIAANAIDEFYIHTEQDTAVLEELTEALSDVSDKTHPRVPSADFVLNQTYVCQFDDDRLYYRGRVLTKVNELARVLFVDYGNVSMVSEVRQCPANLRPEQIAPVAKLCEFVNSGEYDLTSSGALAKQFKTFDWSSVDLRLKSISRVGEGKFGVEIVVGESDENLLSFLTNHSEDVDK